MRPEKFVQSRFSPLEQLVVWALTDHAAEFFAALEHGDQDGIKAARKKQWMTAREIHEKCPSYTERGVYKTLTNLEQLGLVISNSDRPRRYCFTPPSWIDYDDNTVIDLEPDMRKKYWDLLQKQERPRKDMQET